MIAAYRWTTGLVWGSAASLRRSAFIWEWLCYDDSTINIVLSNSITIIITIIIILINQIYLRHKKAEYNTTIERLCRQDTKAVQNCTHRCPKITNYDNKLKTALQRKIKLDKSVLKASHSWRSNNIIGKQIPRINNTITKNHMQYSYPSHKHTCSQRIVLQTRQLYPWTWQVKLRCR